MLRQKNAETFQLLRQIPNPARHTAQLPFGFRHFIAHLFHLPYFFRLRLPEDLRRFRPGFLNNFYSLPPCVFQDFPLFPTSRGTQLIRILLRLCQQILRGAFLF